MSFSNTFETRVLEWVFTAGAVTRPTAWYVGLFTTAPGEAGGGTEVSGGSYARQTIALTVTGDTASNSANVEFPEATASWGTITHMAVFDALSGGNQIAYAALTASKAIGIGDVLRFPIDDIDVTLD
jgi:hypothetical protein